MELVFQSGTNNPLKPLEDEIKDGTLGTISVENKLIINPSMFNLHNYECKIRSRALKLDEFSQKVMFG